MTNYCIAVKEQGDDIVFLRKIVPGGADQSYGIQVAKLAGVPKKVIERAKEIAFELSKADIAACAREIASELSGKAEGTVHRKTGVSCQAGCSQLSLFDAPEETKPGSEETEENRLKQSEQAKVLQTLLSADIPGMTPVEAIMFLDQLQKSAKRSMET